MRRRVYLLRHAEVSYFPGGKPVQPTTVKLTDRGRKQALAAADALSEVEIDRVVTSGLPRTIETAELALGGRELEIGVEPEFEEIRGASFAKIDPQQIRDAFMGAMQVTNPGEARFFGGESFGELAARVVPAWEKLMGESGWETLLLVAHGAVNRAIIAHVLGADAHVYGKLEQDPACINILDCPVPGSSDPRSRYVVRGINITPYNEVKNGIYDTTMEGLWKNFMGEK